jgi:FKBP-type peptidyl-prolyl cis-trans isomerase 2
MRIKAAVTDPLKKSGCTLALIVGLFGCQWGLEDDVVAIGSNVVLHYTLEVDGDIVDTAKGEDPLDYTAGKGPFPGLDEKLFGLKPGDKAEVTVAPTEGYGAHDATLVQRIPRSQLRRAFKVGDILQGPEGRGRVVEVRAEGVIVDSNHPLAGKSLNFSVEIVSVRSSSSSPELRATWKLFEVAIVAIVVLLCLSLVLSNWLPRLRTSTYAPLVLLLVGGGILCAYGFAFIDGEQRSLPLEAQNRPVEEISPETEHVGSKTCRSCHPHNYATWHASYHRTMTQVATPEIVVAPFAGEVLRSGNATFKLERASDALWVEVESTAPTGTERFRRQIVLTTGSHHEQDYWYETKDGRTLARLPFVWRIPEQRWIPDLAVLVTPPDAPRGFGRWNMNCIKCHVTQGRPRGVKFKLFDTKVAEFGIACEACHGPGREHIERHDSILQRYRQHMSEDADETIVLPSRLSVQRQSEVCGQCHSVSMRGSDFKTWLKEGFAFRPGDELQETRHVFRGGAHADHPLTQKRLEEDPMFLEERFWSDGMVRVSGREYNGLIESPCYQHGDESRGVLSCLSCHEMHLKAEDPRPLKVWANDQLGPKMATNDACLQCHEQFSEPESLTAHTHHLANSTGSQCYNCHTPHTTWGLLKAIRSHEIDSPYVQDVLDTGRPNACNLCHLDKTLAWTDETMADRYGHPRSKLNEDQENIAASILSMLTGDAGQRAIVAWHTGWAPAQKISGTHWMVPSLSHLLSDPYDVVRFTALESLKSLPGFAEFDVDPMGPIRQRDIAVVEARRHWIQASRPGPSQPSLLLDASGQLETHTFMRLSQQRDDRRVQLSE